MSVPREAVVPVLAGSLRLACRLWSSPKTPEKYPHEHERVIIAYPGWLDNAGSFDALAPLLARDLDCAFVAMDPPGCGHSDHRPNSAVYNDFEEIVLIGDVADALGVQNFAIFGHSRGGAIAAFAAAVFADRCVALLVCESMMSLSGLWLRDFRSKRDVVDRTIATRTQISRNAERKTKVFRTLEDAIDANANHPDFVKSRRTAKNIVQRHVRPAPGGGFTFTHDVRTYGQMQYATVSEVHTREYLRRICCPVLRILSTNNSWDPETTKLKETVYVNQVKERVQSIGGGDVSTLRIDGGHHLHSDNAEDLAPKLAEWLRPRLDRKPTGPVPDPEEQKSTWGKSRAVGASSAKL